VERVRVGDKDDFVGEVFIWEKTSGRMYGLVKGLRRGKGWTFLP
jgi:hypothetical protein